MASLCDSCPKPGHCCTRMNLGGGEWGRDDTSLEVLIRLATISHGLVPGGSISNAWGKPDVEYLQLGLPFMPLMRDRRGIWTFWCPLLGWDGRCTDYQNRPALCRNYRVGQDTLCVLAKPPFLSPELLSGLAAE